MDLTMKREIAGKERSFKFGFGFTRYLDQKFGQETSGLRMGMAVQTLWPQIMTGSVSPLAEILLAANQTEKNRVTLDQVDDYLESLSAADLDKLIDEVAAMLKKSNATARILKNLEATQK